MITNSGKSTLIKYLLGYSPGFAGYLAIGCGATPSGTNFTADSKGLKFEMARIPIISKGYAGDSLIFTAEIPDIERYGITEIGVFFAKSNINNPIDNQVLFKFNSDESWTYLNQPISSNSNTLIANISIPTFTNFDNGYLNTNRKNIYEQLRFGNETLLIPAGSNTTISLNKNLNYDLMNLNDSFTLAFSVNNQITNENIMPLGATVQIKFTDTNTFIATSTNYSVPSYTNRYNVIDYVKSNFTLSDSKFDWSKIRKIDVITSVTSGMIALDGLRINTSNSDSLYDVIAIETFGSNSLPVEKILATSNFLEFRLPIGVV